MQPYRVVSEALRCRHNYVLCSRINGFNQASASISEALALFIRSSLEVVEALDDRRMQLPERSEAMAGLPLLEPTTLPQPFSSSRSDNWIRGDSS